MEECIFCKIVEGKIPASKVYENKGILAFLDISPANYGHVLVIPKKHFKNMQEITEEYLYEIMKAVKKIAPAILKAMNMPSFNVILSNGKDAGQEVAHIHFHIIPQSSENKIQINLPHKKYEDGKMRRVAERIKKEIK